MVVGAVLVAGCGTGQREQQVDEVVSRFAAAVTSGDLVSACGLLSARTREDLPGGPACQESLSAAGLRLSAGGVVSVWGDRAQVRSGDSAMFLAEFDDGWKVVAAGCQSRGEDLPYRCVVGGR